MNYAYIIRMDNGQYYRSKHDYVSVDYTQVNNEIDATVITDVEDIKYLMSDLPDNCTVEFSLDCNGYYMYLGSLHLEDIKRALNKEA